PGRGHRRGQRPVADDGPRQARHPARRPRRRRPLLPRDRLRPPEHRRLGGRRRAVRGAGRGVRGAARLSRFAITRLDLSRLALSIVFGPSLRRGCVRVIARPRLVEFWESRKSDSEIAERDLTAWYKLATHAKWPNFGALRQTFGSADRVGNCVVFDVGNNRFRLIGRVNFAKGIVYVLKVMDHREYDKGLWVDQCGSHQPPPKLRPTNGKATGRGPKKPE